VNKFGNRSTALDTHQFDMHVVACRRREKLRICCLQFRSNSATAIADSEHAVMTTVSV